MPSANLCLRFRMCGWGAEGTVFLLSGRWCQTGQGCGRRPRPVWAPVGPDNAVRPRHHGLQGTVARRVRAAKPTALRFVAMPTAAHPTAEWTTRQVIEALPGDDTEPRYLIRDRDGSYGEGGVQPAGRCDGNPIGRPESEVTVAEGIRPARDRLHPPGVPRLRIPLWERHLLRVLREYVRYCNESRATATRTEAGGRCRGRARARRHVSPLPPRCLRHDQCVSTTPRLRTDLRRIYRRVPVRPSQSHSRRATDVLFRSSGSGYPREATAPREGPPKGAGLRSQSERGGTPARP